MTKQCSSGFKYIRHGYFLIVGDDDYHDNERCTLLGNGAQGHRPTCSTITDPDRHTMDNGGRTVANVHHRGSTLTSWLESGKNGDDRPGYVGSLEYSRWGHPPNDTNNNNTLQQQQPQQQQPQQQQQQQRLSMANASIYDTSTITPSMRLPLTGMSGNDLTGTPILHPHNLSARPSTLSTGYPYNSPSATRKNTFGSSLLVMSRGGGVRQSRMMKRRHRLKVSIKKRTSSNSFKKRGNKGRQGSASSQHRPSVSPSPTNPVPPPPPQFADHRGSAASGYFADLTPTPNS